MSSKVLQGDCIERMAEMEEASVDAIVTDPPAGISFMGKRWDHNRGGRDAWIAWLAEAMAGALRVCKPGGHAFVWALPRTSHWTAYALEEAGWEVRDRIAHHFGSGFPKSKNLGDGFGTALKPATEDWWLVRKPFPGSITANFAEHGAGGINVDGCRVGFSKEIPGGGPRRAAQGAAYGDLGKDDGSGSGWDADVGRWPANVVFDEEAAAELDAQTGESTSRIGKPRSGQNGDGWGMRATGAEYDDQGGASRFFYCAKTSRGERNAGLEGFDLSAAPVAITPTSTIAKGRSGGKRVDDREPTVTASANHHPTVKPINLMRWLCRLVTPPRGLILDPFLGSGSTGCAAVLEGFDFIGIEREAEYIEIAEARIAFWAHHEGREVGEILAIQNKSRVRAKAAASEQQLGMEIE